MPYDPVDSPFDWPSFGMIDDVRPAIVRLAREGRAMALATLYAVDGGAPREPGAQMLFADGPVAGFLSGGCVEADLAVHAAQVIESGQARFLTYGRGGPVDIALPCGSSLQILLEPMGADDPAIARLAELTRLRRPAVWISDGRARDCVEPIAGLGRTEALRRALLDDDANILCAALEQPFVMARLHRPPTRLVVIGAEPAALALAHLSVQMGLETILVRPRGPLTPPPIPLAYLRLEPQEALDEIAPDPWTAVAVLSHDADQQHAALVAALGAGAGYVGAIGSRHRAAERKARLQAAGMAADQIARLHAPIGLPIGGKTPWQVALAAMAEITASIR